MSHIRLSFSLFHSPLFFPAASASASARYYNYDAYLASKRLKSARASADADADVAPGSFSSVADDEAALSRDARIRREQGRGQLSAVYSNPERLAELRRLEQERVQLDRERKLGLKSKQDTGVRYESRYQ